MVDQVKFLQSYELIRHQIDYSIKLHVQEIQTGWFEKYFLGHFEQFGFGNEVDGVNRAYAAIYQTVGAMCILLIISYCILRVLSLEFAFLTEIAKQWITLDGIAAAIFAGCFVNEKNNLYGKWNYLAELFNSIMAQEKFDQRTIHRMSCFAHDCLIMQMWNHKTFRASFQEVLVWSLIVKFGYHQEIVILEFERIVRCGKFEEIEKLISNLITESGPLSGTWKAGELIRNGGTIC